MKNVKTTALSLRLQLATVALALLTLAICQPAMAKDELWRFGMVADSQQGDDDNPGYNGVSVPMLGKIANDMSTKDVDLVIAVGDLTEAVPVDTTRDNQRQQYMTWKQTMSPFYNNGIGVYAVRGNHEGLAYGYDAVSAWKLEFDYLPSNGPSGDEKQTYSFDNENAMFIGIDMYDTRNVLGVGVGYKESDLPQSWINQQISSSSQEHLFVYGHEPMYGRNHDDGYTGSDRSNFLNSIANGGGGIYICGHDHQHSRSAITDDSGNIIVQQLVLAPAGEKKYGHDSPSDSHDNEINYLNGYAGYYITEVEGPKVTVTLYATADSNESEFFVGDRFSYFSNGKQYLVDQGESYAGLATEIAAGDGYVGTAASLRGGTNSDKDEVVAMGWRTADNFEDADGDVSILTDVLEITGMEETLATDSCDVFVVELACGTDVAGEDISLMYYDDATGNWVYADAADIVYGACSDQYAAGTVGIDVESNTIWGVFDEQGAFAGGTAVPEPTTAGLLVLGAAVLIYRRKYAFNS